MTEQQSCTYADPFSQACPLQDLGAREALQILSRNHRENEEKDEGILSENEEETRLSFQGSFCNCQVNEIYFKKPILLYILCMD